MSSSSRSESEDPSTEQSPTHNTPTRSRKYARPSLRQATLVLPRTGERVRRAFTLSSADVSNQNGGANANANTPLLAARFRTFEGSESATDDIRIAFTELWNIIASERGKSVLKCSLAYVLGSLATLVPAIAERLGHNDGKHMVATVVVYFHPSRTVGSMIEAISLALIAFVYAAVIAAGSMAVSMFFGSKDLLAVGHAIVLVVFCGGGLGTLGWLKQKLHNPLVNVSCSLASLAIITVLTKEGSVHTGNFSFEKVFQVLKMILLGISFSAVVSLVIAPKSARNLLKNDFIRVTDLQETVLTAIARSFFSGSENDFDDTAFEAAQVKYKFIFSSLVKNLRESKFEHYLLGTEQQHCLEVKLVKCVEKISQSLSGLRSAATTQFSLIDKARSSMDPSFDLDAPAIYSPEPINPLTRSFSGSVAMMDSIEELTEPSSSSESGRPTATGQNPADIFSLFIRELGPPMKSLVFTLKSVLHELPFGPEPDFEVMFHENFRSSLDDAKRLFISARREALDTVYSHRMWARKRTPDIDASYEEVAASCGHFSSSLQDLAEDMIQYLETLQELKDVMHQRPMTRSWTWMKVWKKKQETASILVDQEQQPLLAQPETSTSTKTPGSPRYFVETREHKLLKYRHNQSWSYKVWRASSRFRRDDVKYAIKVGLGAILYAMFSFIPSTRPIYSHWRGEWGLVSYMLVCSMNMGASNTTGLQRFIGTCIGASLAVVGWILSRANAPVLGFFGWIISVICFYIMLVHGKGPLARFILLTYNLSALYAYTLSIRDDEGEDDDEGGLAPEIWEIVLHRVVAVGAGCLWGIVVTRIIWPISARKKVKDGVALLWLRMGLIWKRDPLQVLIEGPSGSTYMDIKESIELQRFLNRLDSLRDSATHEYDLRGPFPDQTYRQMLESTARILGAFHAMHVVIVKDLKASRGEMELLRFTAAERTQLSARISHLFTVLASSMKLEYPMNDALPSIEHSRDRFLAKLFAHRKLTDKNARASDEDHELFYAYGLVTGQIASEIQVVSRCIEQLYGVLNEESLKLQ